MKRLLILLMVSLCVCVQAKEKYAVIIGINDYESDFIQDLNYSEADARYLYDMLIRFGRYDPNHIKMLLGADATYANIKDKIYWLGDVARDEDDVFFYFSGHGTRIEDRDDNEDDKMDEAFCPFETDLNRESSVILDDEIGHWFNRIRSKQIIVVLDCCHSGGAAGRSVEDKGSRGLEMAGNAQSKGFLEADVNPYAKDITAKNKFIISASDAHEQSFENPQLGHGVFTYYLGEAIRGNADENHDKLIKAHELYDYTREKTLAFAKTINQTQTPVKFGTLDNAVIVEVGKQLCNLNYYDRDLKIVGLSVSEDMAQIGDRFLIKKSMKSFGSTQISDREIFKVEINRMTNGVAEARILEAYYGNIQIDPSSYGDYYAEKISLGILQIFTKPWAVVYLDGKEMGPTPVILDKIPAGDHDLLFRTQVSGYVSEIRRKIKVGDNEVQKIVETFRKK